MKGKNKDKMKKKDGRSIPRETMEYFRMQAIKLRKKGRKIKDIAEDFGVHRCAVSHWLTKQKRKGIKSLKRKKAPGAKPKLEKKQVKKLLSYIKKPASKFGFETDLWDCSRVRILIKKKFGVGLHKTNVWKMLHSWKFTPQKPEKRSSQQDEDLVKNWLEVEWPEIEAHAKRWQAIIYFQDESGVSLIPVVGTTWAPKGKTPIIRVTGKRGGLCVTSAISPSGRMVFRLEKGRVNSEKHKEFLQQLLRNHPRRKIIVIEDRAPAHRSKKIQEFVKENKKRLAIYYLPPYSPELNLDEKVWWYLKKHKLKGHQAQSVDDLRALVLSKMKSMQKKKGYVKALFDESYVLQSTK